jgi:hypothetical protein
MPRFSWFRKRLKSPKIKPNSLSNLTRTTLSGEIIEINKLSVDKPDKIAHAVLPDDDTFGMQYDEM